MVVYTFAQLPDWVQKVERRRDAVVKDATQSVVGVMQKRVPVDTGFLKNSLMSSLTGGSGTMGPASHIMVAASMKGGDTAAVTYTAEYAAPVNNGNRGRPGAHFVEGAVDMWPQIVRASVAKAKAAVG